MARLAAFPRRGTPYTECLYRALDATGVEVREGDFSIRWLLREIGGIDCFHFHWPSLAYAYRRTLRTTLRHLARFLLFLAIIKLRGRKILWTAHNLYPHDKGGRMFVLIDAAVRRLIVRLSSAIFVHGPTARRIVAAEFPAARGRLVQIDHGHMVDHYANTIARPDARAKLNIRPDTFVYLFIGICKEYKNLESLIATFGEVPGDTLLVIAGRFQDDEYRERIGGLAARQPNVRLVPIRIPDDELQIYINASDTIVLPYTDILTSGAAMLAISFGRPVVAPRRGYLQDVITEDCGVLYEPGDPGALLGAMNAIRARSFDRAQIVRHALSYDWNRTAETTRLNL